MKKILKFAFSLCFVFMLFGVFSIDVQAAKPGDTKTEVKYLSYNEVCAERDRLEDALDYNDGSAVARFLTNTVFKIPGISFLYSGWNSLVKADIKNDYNFYKNIERDMRNNNKTNYRAKITYTYKYEKYSVGNDYMYDWKYKSKTYTLVK